ncbi:MAG: polyhydroxyalkanoic acid system family protein [Gammaproteobacteria bacterium]|nr:polyhydroxyalkanoic acid system family protein [Gammaproteobacteria bacterium]
MSHIHIKQGHALSQETVRERVESIAKDLHRQYKINYAWQGNRLLFKRQGATGHLDLGDGFIEMDIKLGLVLSPLKGKIEQTIRQDIKAQLSGSQGTRLA